MRIQNSIVLAFLVAAPSSAQANRSFDPVRHALERANHNHPFAGFIKKRKLSSSSRIDQDHRGHVPSMFQLNDEQSDCFEDDYFVSDAIYAKSESINYKDSPSNNLKSKLRDTLKGCYFACPGEAYYSNDDNNVRFCSVVATMRQKMLDLVPKNIAIKKEKRTNAIVEEEIVDEEIKEPSATILNGIVRPLIPTNIWNSLTGREFFYPSTLAQLSKTGIDIVSSNADKYIDWKPADSKTKKLLELDNEEIRAALANDESCLVWIGRFKEEGHGSHLPVIKTKSILPLAPKDLASLLMDSSKVQSYNKMSLGRKDEVVFQEVIDSDSESGPLGIAGEAKIVRNLTKPPLAKKLMEFVTVMYARRINSDDDVEPGLMGGQDGYAVISRAVAGGKWSQKAEDQEDERTRSEILIGMNLIRNIPGEDDKCEVTAVTHCNSPSVPQMLAGKVGIKGAVDFVRDIRNMFSE